MSGDTPERNGAVSPTALLWVILALSLGTVLSVVVMSLLGSKDITTVLSFVTPILVSLLAMKAHLVRTEARRREAISQAQLESAYMEAKRAHARASEAVEKAEIAASGAVLAAKVTQNTNDMVADQVGKIDALHDQSNSRWADIKAELAKAQAKIDALQYRRLEDNKGKGV